MFRQQVMFVALCSMLLLTFAYADQTSVSSGTPYIDTMKTPTDFRGMIAAIVQIIKKHTMGNSTGPLNIFGAVHKQISIAKKYEKELSEEYEEMLNKKRNYEEIEQKVNQMSSVGLNNEIQQKLTEVKATASEGFQKLNEIEKMKEDLKQAIHEYEKAGEEYIAQVAKAFEFVNSLLLGKETDVWNILYSLPALVGEMFSKISSSNTYTNRVLEMLDKLRKSCTKADKKINRALKGLQEVEEEQKPIFEMKKSKALGVKDAQGNIITKDSTSAPSLLSNFACFAGVMMLTVMSTNYL